MAVDLVVYVDRDQLNRLKRDFDGFEKDLLRVLVRGVNRVTRSVRTRLVRLISTKTAIPQKLIRDRNISMRLANYSLPESLIRIKGGRLPIVKLKARQTDPGVTYKLGDARILLPHSFIAVMPSGHRGVFLREGKSRLPIHEQYVISIPEILRTNQPEVDRIVSDGEDSLAKEIDSQASLILKQRDLAA